MPRNSKKKKSEEWNILFWTIIALIVAYITVVYFLRRRYNINKSTSHSLTESELNEIELQIQKLEVERDSVQKKRFSVKTDLLYYHSLKTWAEGYISRKFAQFRWMLFVFVTTLFIISGIEGNSLGITTDTLLNWISVIIIITALFFFASTEEDQSLWKSYKKIKSIAIDKSAVVISWLYKKFLGIDLEKEDFVGKEHQYYLQLVPIMNELRELKKRLRNDSEY